MSSRAWTVANALMLGAFIVASIAELYWNAEPIPWLLLYGLAAVMCAVEMRRKTVTPLTGLVGAIALIWAGLIFPHSDMYKLFLVAGAMFAVAFASDRRVREAIQRDK